MIAINETYSINEIKSEGFKEKPLKELTAKVFEKKTKYTFSTPSTAKSTGYIQLFTNALFSFNLSNYFPYFEIKFFACHQKKNLTHENLR